MARKNHVRVGIANLGDCCLEILITGNVGLLVGNRTSESVHFFDKVLVGDNAPSPS